MAIWPDTRQSLLTNLANPENQLAWQKFELAYIPALYRFSRSMGLQPADANEVVQEVLMTLHRKIANWKPQDQKGSFRAWLLETSRRQCQSLIRKHRQQKLPTEVVISKKAFTSDDAEDAAHELEQRRWNFLLACGEVESEVLPTTWQAFWLSAVEDLPIKEIQQRLNLSPGSIYTAKCRVLHKIRQRVQLNERGEQ